MHYVELRRTLENIFMVDSMYRGMHRNRNVVLSALRSNNNLILGIKASMGSEELFWNLVYYFSLSGFPFEFMLPYKQQDPKADRKSFYQVI